MEQYEPCSFNSPGWLVKIMKKKYVVLEIHPAKDIPMEKPSRSTLSGHSAS